jgi:hypothetical protein
MEGENKSAVVRFISMGIKYIRIGPRAEMKDRDSRSENGARHHVGHYSRELSIEERKEMPDGCWKMMEIRE